MQFADYVVCAALQLLSGCLKRIGQRRDGRLTATDGRAIRQVAERLGADWQLVRTFADPAMVETARAGLVELVLLTNGATPPEQKAAQRLLERAEGKAAGHLREMINQLADEPAAERAPRDRVGELLLAESARFRAVATIGKATDGQLIDQGMLRALCKAQRALAALDRRFTGSGNFTPGVKRLRRAVRWVQHSANHLELLRGALSDAGKKRLWHLNHLAAKLEEQWALERLARTAVLVDLRPKASARLSRLIRSERVRLDKQRRKLAEGAFASDLETCRSELSAAVGELGLEAIVLLPLGGPRQAQPGSDERPDRKTERA
jgi:glucose/arabinose dehydrogenase